MTGKKQA